MIGAILLAVCLTPPFFDQDMANGPTCTPTNQDIECRCSECVTWEPVFSTSPTGQAIWADWYDLRRVDQDGTVHTVIGSSKIHYSYVDDDGVTHPKWTENWYCFANDASTPMDGRRYIYTIRACAAAWTPTCSPWSTSSVTYIGIPIRCYDQSSGGEIACPKL